MWGEIAQTFAMGDFVRELTASSEVLNAWHICGSVDYLLLFCFVLSCVDLFVLLLFGS